MRGFYPGRQDSQMKHSTKTGINGIRTQTWRSVINCAVGSPSSSSSSSSSSTVVIEVITLVLLLLLLSYNKQLTAELQRRMTDLVKGRNG